MRDAVGRVKPWRYLLPLLSACIFLVGFQGQCQHETKAWQAMETHKVLLIGPGGKRIELPVKIADEETERRAGFQHVCPRTIAKSPMLFIFPRSVRVSFHMNNVHAPLQIGFFGAEGTLIDVQLMQPYGPPPGKRHLYDPGQPVRAALEAEAGFFEQYGLAPGQWRLVYP